MVAFLVDPHGVSVQHLLVEELFRADLALVLELGQVQSLVVAIEVVVVRESRVAQCARM